MDAPPPDDFDPYGDRVNYGRVENGAGTSKIVWWILGGIMALQVVLFAGAIQFVGGALYSMNARLAVVETRLSECSK